MANLKLDKSEISADLGFQVLTEAVTSALLRAMDERPNFDPKRIGRITAGIWIDPENPNRSGPSIPSKGNALPLSQNELMQISTKQPINRVSVGQLNDMFAKNPVLGKHFIASLAKDYRSTMATVFQLSDDELDILSQSESEDAEMLANFANLLDGHERIDYIVFDVNTETAKAKEKRKAKWSFKVKCDGGQSGGQGNWSCGGEVGVTF